MSMKLLQKWRVMMQKKSSVIAQNASRTQTNRIIKLGHALKNWESLKDDYAQL
jgi:hypothetical protein